MLHRVLLAVLAAVLSLSFGCARISYSESQNLQRYPSLLIGLLQTEGGDVEVYSFPRKSVLADELAKELQQRQLVLRSLFASRDGQALAATCCSRQVAAMTMYQDDTVLLVTSRRGSDTLVVDQMTLLDDARPGLPAEELVLVTTIGRASGQSAAIAIDKKRSVAWIKRDEDRSAKDDRTGFAICGEVALLKNRRFAEVRVSGLPPVTCVVLGDSTGVPVERQFMLFASPGFATEMFGASIGQSHFMVVDRAKRQVCIVASTDQLIFLSQAVALTERIEVLPWDQSRTRPRAYLREPVGTWKPVLLDPYLKQTGRSYAPPPAARMFPFSRGGNPISGVPNYSVVVFTDAQSGDETTAVMYDSAIPADCLPVWVAR